MPELPEVETLCRQLNAALPGEKILRIEVLDPRLGNIARKSGDSAIIFPGSVPNGSDLEKVAGLVGRRVEEVTRRGKYIHIQMKGGLTAALHLRMSGRLLYRPADMLRKGGTGASLPFARLVIAFSSGTLVLLDPRRFATFVVQPPTWSVPALPDDPMQGLPVRRLREIARTRRLPVKSFLMDQRLIAGIGNIYACEILHASGIDPRRPACSLSAAEWRKAAKAAAVILRRAVDCRGTTMSDWRDLFGCSGTNQDHLEVYSRQGAPCRRCGGRIERITQSGRGTWFCPSCQK
jgi:formamidopyrimidine-DNA glycosylase